MHSLNRMDTAGQAGTERTPRYRIKFKKQGLQYNLICTTCFQSIYAAVYINNLVRETITSGYL